MEQLVEELKLKFNEQGLIPAIVQDAASGQVLMVAYMNPEALVRTLASGETWFWSRSRRKFWHKGESSGHVQKVKNIYFDCDRDTLLIEVEQVGAACHEGFYSCFHYLIDEMAPGGFRVVGERLFDPEQVYGNDSDKSNINGSGSTGKAQPVAAGGNSKAPIGPEILSELAEVISRRLRERPAGSYTAKIQERGIDYALKKIGEETAEFITAIKNGEPGAIAAEAADVIYHMLVALFLSQVSPAAVWEELAARRK